MIKVISAVIMAAIIVAAVWLLPQSWFEVLVAAVALVGLYEFGRMFFPDAFERACAVIFGMAAVVGMLFCPDKAEAALISLVAAAFFGAMVVMWRAGELASSANRVALIVFGVLYLGVSFSFWGWLRAMDFGRELVLLALAPACLCDTLGYAVGKTLGRRKLAPMVSPNKTIEGFAGALAGSLLGVFVVRAIVAPFVPVSAAIALAVIIWITSPLGDLIESMLKRSCGVKDSGAVIPGHGGILDRLDALIFTAPAAYLWAKIFLDI